MYKYKNNIYCIITTQSKHKDINTGNWITCVLYKRLNEETIYSREYNDFFSKFESVDNI